MRKEIVSRPQVATMMVMMMMEPIGCFHYYRVIICHLEGGDMSWNTGGWDWGGANEEDENMPDRKILIGEN